MRYNTKEERRDTLNIIELVQSQRSFYNTHQTRSYAYRIEMLQKLKSGLETFETEIFEALKQDLNKAQMESFMTEVGIVRGEIHYFLHHLKQLMKPKRVKTPLVLFHAKSLRMPEPYGVVLIMSPWNYPFQLAMAPLVGAIAAGNTIVLKPASYTPHVSDVIAKMIASLYPENYISTVLGGREANQLLLEQVFDYIFFTGSTNVGKLVMEKASAHLTPVTLELGGKSPCIVFESKDVALAAKRVAFGKYLNSGQTCIAPDYCIIERSLFEPFVKHLQAEVVTFFGSEPLENHNLVQIVNLHHTNRLLQLIPQDRLLFGGKHKDRFIEPTAVGPVTMEDAIMQEEIFGPILPFVVVDKADEIEAFITKIDRPLAFYLFTDNQRLKETLLNQISFGGATVNDTIMHIASTDLGFGGVGASGMGQYHGKFSFDTFTHYKSVLFRSKWIDLPFRYHPYNEKKFSFLRKFMK